MFRRLVVVGVPAAVCAGFVLQALGTFEPRPVNGWLAVAVGLAVGVVMTLPKKMAVGAHWLRVGRKWVRLYELSRIEITRTGFGPFARLTGQNRRSVGVMLSDLQADRDLWDYVYLGILHSVVSAGASTNRLAGAILGSPDGGRTLPPSFEPAGD